MGRPSICTLVLAGTLTFLGCESNHYEIELTPKGDSLQRDLTARRGSEKQVKPFPVEELKKLAVAYDAAVPADRKANHHFSKMFRGQMPDDLGGSGRYVHWETDLGTASGYIERYRGNDDLLSNMENRLKAADRYVDLMEGWLESHLNNEPGFPALQKFFDTRVRRDLKNLSLHAWSGRAEFSYEDDVLQENLFRTGQYLVERSYFSWEELPKLSRFVHEATENKPAPLLEYLQRFLATKMNIPPDQPIPASLNFLSDPKVIHASLNQYLRPTDEYKDLIRDWEKNPERDPESKKPEPSAVLNKLLDQAFNITIHPPDQLTVKLNLPQAPLMSNGKWDEKTQQVQWQKRLLAADSHLVQDPTILYAVWSEPDPKMQSKHFGRVILKGNDLLQYCLWFHSLSKTEANEWKTFLAALRPDTNLTEKLESFRFSEGPGEQTNSPITKLIRSLLTEALSKNDP